MRFVLKYKIRATKQGVCEVMRMNFVVYFARHSHTSDAVCIEHESKTMNGRFG